MTTVPSEAAQPSLTAAGTVPSQGGAGHLTQVSPNDAWSEPLGGHTVAIVGLGYVGLPLAVAAVRTGCHVVGYDVDGGKLAKLAAGASHVEDVPSSVLAECLGTGRFLVTDKPQDLAGFDYAVITVPTPLRDSVPDLSYIEAATRTLAAHLRPGATVVLESTTYPGTTEEVVLPLLQDGSGLHADHEFGLGFSPERIRPGDRQWNLMNTPKVVSGIDAASLDAVDSFYRSLGIPTVRVSAPRVAEMTKIFENTFMQVNIALSNEFSEFAHLLDIDFWEVLRAASSKPHGFMPFTPGPGVGGHCLPIDPMYMLWRTRNHCGRPIQFIDLADQINSGRPAYVARRLMDGLNRQGKPLNGARVLVLGAAYKPNVGDLRETPAFDVIRHLHGNGAKVEVHDPHVADLSLFTDMSVSELSVEALAQYDAVVILANHDIFDYSLIQSGSRYVLDCRNSYTWSSPTVERI